MHIDLVIFMLSVAIGAFILLIYMLTLKQESRSTASWPIMLAAFSGATLASAYLSSISLLALMALICVVVGLVLTFFSNTSVIALFIAWVLITGAALGRDLVFTVIPFTMALGGAVIIILERKRCL